MQARTGLLAGPVQGCLLSPRGTAALQALTPPGAVAGRDQISRSPTGASPSSCLHPWPTLLLLPLQVSLPKMPPL